ncbi:helix-loop-helix protein delilah [Cephus cinctus]|uniref:Helix-loop-helix protein delilah n=1 Tax=Cephus cinctus TaxID=211228 RepID=A0AAJ7FEC3_CEPCN|nr:helix-loop-helix protein delilah [Cephus cinctus]
MSDRMKACGNSSEKYCLRPRGVDRRKSKIVPDGEDSDPSNSTKSSEQRVGQIENKSASKQRTAPLSKYRRKTANARERSRMREINLAFETLRKAVPSYMPQLVLPGDGPNEKLTKITTLRLAMKYIAGLTELLRKEERTYVMDETVEYLNCHSAMFRDGRDTCTLTALNTPSTFDIFGTGSHLFNDGGSDGESFHSGATLDNFIEQSIESLVPDLDLDFPDSLLNTELS